jgi:CubicO group peptidase (beta-lactamase class C family)/glyoxylase-like metal-dependent hydrolase (beta-lactamase superfamily II)
MKAFIVFLLLAACGASTVPRTPTSTPDLEVTEIGEGLVVITTQPHDANVLLVETKKGGLILVSSPMEAEDTGAILAWSKKRYGKVPDTAINPHWHKDGTGGNELLHEAGVHTLSSELTAKLLAEKATDRKPVPADHTIPVKDKHKLELGGEEVWLVYPGPSHSSDHIGVFFPHQRVLFGGCAVRSDKWIGYLGDADLESWPQAMDVFAALDPKIVVPGHGKRFDPAMIAETKEAALKEQKAKPSLQSPLGAKFELPPGWTSTAKNGAVLIQDPAKELSVWMVDSKRGNGAAAVAAAWKQVMPSFAREVLEVISPPLTEGWDRITEISYAIPAKESRVVTAVNREKAGVAYVILVDAPLASLQKRGAQLNQLVESQKPAGLKEESFAGKTAKPWNPALAKQLDAFVEDARNRTRVPGAAVAVIQGGKIVFEMGYGTRRLRGADKVTPDTAFLIGSVTKPLTSLLMGLGVDRGLYSWTTPMKDVLPRFALADPAVEKKIELQHSVCACTGLPRQDMEFLFEFKGRTAETRLAELATMKPTTDFGETFQYSNALVSAGGLAIAHVRFPRLALTKAYEKAMEEEVFRPLGMSSTTFDKNEAIRGNHALPHGGLFLEDYVEIPLSYEDAVFSVSPAGGAWSTARDMARWVQLELARGALPNRKRLISEAALLERRRPRVQYGKRRSYGLALGISEEDDLVTIGHTGGTLGFTTRVDFWPDHDLGLVILTNAQGAGALTATVERKLLELLFDAEPKADKALAFFEQRRDESTAAERKKTVAPPPRAWIDPWLGSYQNPSLGVVTLKRQGEDVIFDAGEWKSRVGQHNDAGESTIILLDPSLAGVPFQLQPDKSLLLDVGQQKYVFKR